MGPAESRRLCCHFQELIQVSHSVLFCFVFFFLILNDRRSGNPNDSIVIPISNINTHSLGETLKVFNSNICSVRRCLISHEPFELYSAGQEKVRSAVNCYLQTGLGGGGVGVGLKRLAFRLTAETIVHHWAAHGTLGALSPPVSGGGGM